MEFAQKNRFSEPVTVFHERRLPAPAFPIGYAALVDGYDLAVPLPRTLSAVWKRHTVEEQDDWTLFTPRHRPDDTLAGHLTFALKHEGVDLCVLKRLFLACGAEPIEQLVRDTPTGRYARRIWFFYEWLLDARLDIDDLGRANYVDAIDEAQQYAAEESVYSRRHRVRDNLPGTPEFCPLVFRTDELEAFRRLDLPNRARSVLGEVPASLLRRAAAFLLLEDSRASYAIEGEQPPRDREQRWANAIGQAGSSRLDLDELLRLQQVVVGDSRFVRLGLRDEGGFVGRHDRSRRIPIPSHISARSRDLPSLLEGLLQTARSHVGELDPVVAAACVAFGFVYIHPFQDGNGRIHRYLIHHVLARNGFHPRGFVFPVSAAILDRIEEYRAVLESYSEGVLPLVEWESTEDGNVRVLNDTADFYRYFDATEHAQFLYRCVQQTIEEDLPEEVAFLESYDAFEREVQTIVDMPASTVDLLFRFLHQNDGRLSKRARTNEFSALTDDEVARVEAVYGDAFDSADA